jgi:uncharacterized protein (DUF983 family)
MLILFEFFHRLGNAPIECGSILFVGILVLFCLFKKSVYCSSSLTHSILFWKDLSAVIVLSLIRNGYDFEESKNDIPEDDDFLRKNKACSSCGPDLNY